MKKKTYYTIEGSSRCAGNVRWYLRRNISEKEIIEWAEDKCNKRGDSLKSLAGIGFLEEEDRDERPFHEGEEFEMAVKELGDDSRTYKVFDDSNPEKVKDFLEMAESIGYGEDAQELIDERS